MDRIHNETRDLIAAASSLVRSRIGSAVRGFTRLMGVFVRTETRTWPLVSFTAPQFSRIFRNSLEISNMEDEILTIAEVAKLLKINEKTAYRLASQSRIPGFKVGGSWRFRADELRRWMVAQAQSNKKAAPQ